jgi:hypothetical protein
MARPQEDQTMRGQSRIEAFNKTIAAAEARHGKAISEAYRVFNTKHSAAKRLHRSTYMAAYTASCDQKYARR